MLPEMVAVSCFAILLSVGLMFSWTMRHVES